MGAALFSRYPDAELLAQGYAELKHSMERYLSPEAIAAVTAAALFGAEAHKNDFRKSGEAYFVHPLAVATILARQHFDEAVLQAALLHDVIEDTEYDYASIQKRFGQEVADMVEGVTKLGKIKDKSPQELAAGSFMKMMIAITNDPRVVLIKFADRLHNMQTLGALRPDKRRRIARETMEVYVNLAERFGLYSFRMELEDLAFSHMHPWRYAVIQAHYQRHFANSHTVRSVEEEMAADLKRLNLRVQFLKRRRHLWGIYKRMKRKDTFAEALRTLPLRLITENEDDCYRVLGSLHRHYRPIEGKFHDFIAAPKNNGYRSLHSSVVRRNQALNVQIRSQEMNIIAEKGILTLMQNEYQARQFKLWLGKDLDSTLEASEYYAVMKQELSPKEVHVYTPQGKIIDLDSGATAVDFAYAVHSHLGDHCVAAKVNGMDYPLHLPLRTAQTVEIIKDEAAHPQAQWLQFVVSERARVGIKKYLARLAREEALQLGKKLLEQSLQSYGLAHQSVFAALQNYLQREQLSEERLLIELGQNKRSLPLLLSALLGQVEFCADPILKVHSAGDQGVHLGDCCHPLPGDALCGHFDLQSGIRVHRADCDLANSRLEGEAVRVEWATPTVGEFTAALSVEVQESRGLLGQVSALISEHQINIQHLLLPQGETERGTRLLMYWLEVADLASLQDLMRHLRRIAGVRQVYRGVQPE